MPDAKFYRTPLHIAELSEKIEIVKFLLNQPGLDIRAKALSGETALTYACRLNTPLEIIAVLIAKYPDLVKLMTDRLESPLQIAISSRRLDIVRFLIEQCGADPNHKDANGEHALFYSIRCFDESIINFLMYETNCDMKQRNNNDWTAFEQYFNSHLYYENKPLICEIFRLTYNEFSSPHKIDRLLIKLKYEIPIFHYSNTNKEHDILKMAILESIYQSPCNNPDHYELVTRLLGVDLRSENGYEIHEKFWLCVSLQSKDVLKQIDAGRFQQIRLEIMFRLFVYAREIFAEYLPFIAKQLSNDIRISFKKFKAHETDPSMIGYLLEYLKTLCLFGMKVRVPFVTHELQLIQICLPFQPNVWPFIRFPTTRDTLICRHFKETDSGDDVERYVIFREQFNNGMGYGFVPTLFNISRSVVRRAVFDAAGSSSSKKLLNLHTIEDIPVTVKSRLCYLP